MLDADIWALPTTVGHDAAHLTITNQPSSVTSSGPAETCTLVRLDTSDAVKTIFSWPSSSVTLEMVTVIVLKLIIF